MRKIILPIAGLVLFLGACGNAENEMKERLEKEQQAYADAIEESGVTEEKGADLFHSVDGKFKINFNGEPTETSEIIPTEVGDIEMTSFMYEKSATEVYLVAYNDYPSDMVKNSSVDDMLDGAKNGSSSSMNIVSFDVDENLEIEGNPGRHFKGNNGSYYVEYKLFMKENRLYQIAIIRDGSYATSERSEEFYGSFELLEEEEEEELI